MQKLLLDPVTCDIKSFAIMFTCNHVASEAEIKVLAAKRFATLAKLFQNVVTCEIKSFKSF